MLQFLPYAMAAYGGYRGYKSAKDSGASGIGRLLGAAGGAYGGYTLGSAGMSMFPGSAATKAFAASQPAFLASLPGAYNPARTPTAYPGMNQSGEAIFASDMNAARRAKNLDGQGGGSLLDIFRKKGSDEYDPMKIALAAGGIPFLAGAFDQGPVDM